MSKLLWKPSDEQIKQTEMYRFIHFINSKYNKSFTEYTELYEWSVQNIPDFWASFWNFCSIKASVSYVDVIDNINRMPGAKWFKGARLNFAENLLKFRDNQTAIIFKGEDKVYEKITYAELYDETARLAKSLKDIGVKPNDRVAGYMPNMPQTIIAMLAASSIGAVWSSCSPDFGVKGVLDRFGQIKPKILFTADGYFFKGNRIDAVERISNIVREIPSIEKVIVTPYTKKNPDISMIKNSVVFDDFKSFENALKIDFEQLPFDHPVYIMYSSGTTGLPKCMVQGFGVLLNHFKEHMLHIDLKRKDTVFYFTTCGWAMWNWLVSSLGTGASIVLYEGHHFYPDPGVLWKMTQDEKITVFGTSAGYIAALQKSGLRPCEKYDLSSLRSVVSTGAPLFSENFEFVYDSIKKDIHLASISGGTDLNGCFVTGNPMSPVYAGEIQCRALGMKVESFDENGIPLLNKQGELVCTAPFPSMPVYFWDDPGDKKYLSAYFDVYPNIWRHGDYIMINNRGGVVIYGRSDATLNPGGVRMGTAEIYTEVEQIPEIEDSLVIGQNWKNDIRVILFVKMTEQFKLTDALKNKIKNTIRTNVSPRHVPAKIIPVRDIPYTLNMKKVELAVKNIIHDKPVLNKDSLKNPEALDQYADIKDLQL